MEHEGLPEHRRHARVPQELRVRLCDSAARSLDGDGLVVDLSRAGLALLARVPLDAGSALGFRLSLPDGGTIGGDARVRWSCPRGPWHVAGLEIVRIGFWDRRRLLRYLAPGRLDLLHAGELALQCALAIGILFLVRGALAVDLPLRGALADVLPMGLLTAGPVWGLYMLARSLR